MCECTQFICSAVDAFLSCFQFGVTTVVPLVLYPSFGKHVYVFLLGINLGVELLDHKVCECLTVCSVEYRIWTTNSCPNYTPTSRVPGAALPWPKFDNIICLFHFRHSGQ